MKFFFFILPGLFLFSCNNNAENGSKTPDSLQQLLQSIRDSIRNSPADLKPRYNLAIVLQDAGKYQEALLALDSMNISQPDSTDPYIFYNYLFKRSELLELIGDTTKAIETLELFVLPGELTQSGLRLANLYAETRNPKVLEFCDAMLKNDASGSDPHPHYFKGIYYYQVNAYENALKEFDKSIQKDYTFIDAYMEKGNIYFKQKKYTEAIAVYDLALNVSNTFADAYYYKALCQEALNQKTEARANYIRAYGLDPEMAEAKEAAYRLK